MKKPKILYIDLDDTLADFFKATRDKWGMVQEDKMYEPNFFFNLDPIPGAQGAVRRLMTMGFDIWILTQPLAEHHASYSDKVKWVGVHFPHLWNKIVMTQDKGLHVGDYLIDDNSDKWKSKFEKNGGKFVHFKYNRELKDTDSIHKKEWEQICDLLATEDSAHPE
jgi:5'(3')-deoxyribonucleotidase